MVAQTTGSNTPLTPIQAAWLRALTKAQRLGTTPLQHGGGHYTVTGSQGATYHVRRLDPHGLTFSCDCPAGQEARPCYHQAACAALPAEAALRRVYRRRQAIAARKAQAA